MVVIYKRRRAIGDLIILVCHWAGSILRGCRFGRGIWSLWWGYSCTMNRWEPGSALVPRRRRSSCRRYRFVSVDFHDPNTLKCASRHLHEGLEIRGFGARRDIDALCHFPIDVLGDGRCGFDRVVRHKCGFCRTCREGIVGIESRKFTSWTPCQSILRDRHCSVTGETDHQTIGKPLSVAGRLTCAPPLSSPAGVTLPDCGFAKTSGRRCSRQACATRKVTAPVFFSGSACGQQTALPIQLRLGRSSRLVRAQGFMEFVRRAFARRGEQCCFGAFFMADQADRKPFERTFPKQHQRHEALRGGPNLQAK